MPNVRDVAYEVDGMTMVGSLGVPHEPGPRPAVLIAHEANGLADYQKSRARQLAELGYVAFALDYHGGGSPPEFADAQARTSALWDDPDRMRSIGQAGLDVLLAEPATDGLPGLRYDQPAAERSWREMLDLFDEVFRPS